MAKSGRGGSRRSLPSTPPPKPPPADSQDGTEGTSDSAGGTPVSGAAPAAPAPAHGRGASARPAGDPAGAAKKPGRRASEPEYLITGTGCTAGHPRGHELDAGRLGKVPTRKATRIGLFLVLWCALGIGLVVDSRWLSFGIQVVLLWLGFSAIVQRRAGHRGHCWRTRAWRHAWGGLAPGGADPTRPAGT